MLKQANHKTRKKALLSILVLVVLLFMAKICYLNKTTYAYTLSLGNGCGFVIYTDHYRDLPPILQESIRFHENIHLQEGTYAFWEASSLERRAYTAQIKELQRKRIELSLLFQQTKLDKYSRDYFELAWFETAMAENLKAYTD